MRTLLFLGALGLCACTTTVARDPPTGPRIGWTCAGGASFSVRLTESGNAEVEADGQTYHLPGVIAGSGTRYTDGRVEFWERGGEAFLNGAAGGPYETCTRPE